MVKIIHKKQDLDQKKDFQTESAIKKLHHLSEEQKASDLAKSYDLPYTDLNLIPISPDDVRLISEEESHRLRCGIFYKNGKDVRMAITDPANEAALVFVESLRQEKGWVINKYIVSDSSLQKIFQRYKESSFMEVLDIYRLSLSGKDLENFQKNFGALIKLQERATEMSTTDLLRIIMAGAISMGSSDIHFEPSKEKLRIRYRIDGLLQDLDSLPPSIYRLILSRIKIMSKMKLNVADMAQDGRFGMEFEEGRIDVRVSSIPGSHGESIVMRLLDQTKVLPTVEKLGMRGLAYTQLQNHMQKSSGMIVITGPTGSGKTTTLYSLINKLNTSDVKIITIEDPIEYEVQGISQTQINTRGGYTFAKGLRAIVRQDPDIVLVGEIRDEETADIAVNAALTGHLVLSTFHTNNAVASIPRFMEMGVKPALLLPAINAFVAQRLVRQLCVCKETYEPAKETVHMIQRLLSIISPKADVEIPKEINKLYRPRGCSKCHNLGYKGRIGIFEVLTIDSTIEELVLDFAGETEITKAALEHGMVTMTQDGILKAVEGITTIEEVWRVAAQGEFLEEMYEKLMAQSFSHGVTVMPEQLSAVSHAAESFERFSELVTSQDPKDFLPIILGGGLYFSAGDIHVEPGDGEVFVRYRLDGILQTVARFPLVHYPQFLGKIKILCGFEGGVRSGVLDGRFAIDLLKPFENISETKIDVRVSIILGGYGETVVMRLLNKSAGALDVHSLGIRRQTLERILIQLRKPNGIFLNTGPTGSGKTTTLYSLLSIVNKPSIKIITVEDPIEYQLAGVLQTQANDKDGYTFATALRSLLRQNPDVMMIGEIRDEDTAKIAVQAALTGHLIFSTLHTNDAAGSIQRLLNMGVDPEDLATASNAFMAQRLIRRLCTCKKKIMITPEIKGRLLRILTRLTPKSGVDMPSLEYVYESSGCEKCNNIGYKGRSLLSELLEVDSDIEVLISQRALVSEISAKAVENGMITMAMDGALQILEGITTLEEVERMTDI